MLALGDISKITLGTMQFLWTSGREDALSVLDRYLELGGNCIDTADVYTNWAAGIQAGDVERLIGDWLKNRRREDILLMSKVGSEVWPGPDGKGLGRQHVRKAIDESLSRLKTDYLDVYVLHFPDEATPIDETLQVMDELISQGKIRYVGFSNYRPDQVEALLGAATAFGIPVSLMQAYYNLIDRQTYRQDFGRLAETYDITVCSYGSLASGFLSGAFRPGLVLPEHSRAPFAKEKMTAENLHLLARVEAVAQRHGKTISQTALAWLVQQPSMGSAIIGADTVQQLEENFIDDASWLLPSELRWLEGGDKSD